MKTRSPHLTLATLAAIVAAAGAFAQTTEIPSPKSPVLPRTPAQASWTITFKYAGEGTPTKPDTPTRYLGDAVRSLTITKTGSTYREQANLASGKTVERWQFGGMQLAGATDSKAVFVVLPPREDSPDPAYYDYSRSDFPELAWVSQKNFRGLEKFEGKPAFLFESEESGKRLRALLSVDTQVPLFFSDGETERVYAANPPPPAPLTPPQNFLDAFARHKKAADALNYRPGPP